MKCGWTRKTLLVGLSALMVAAGLKAYYSAASVNGLRWILAPTTLLVEVVTGETFWFESYAGYINADRSFLIAGSCSGVNFLITAFLMLVFTHLWQTSSDCGWRILPIAFVAAYFSTIAANTVRISAALKLHRMDPELIWVNPEQLHLLEGIFIYFGFLLMLFLLSESINRARQRSSSSASLPVWKTTVPLLIYWFITLAVPLANGASGTESGFWNHAMFVVLTPLLLLLPLLIILRMLNRRRRSSKVWLA